MPGVGHIVIKRIISSLSPLQFLPISIPFSLPLPTLICFFTSHSSHVNRITQYENPVMEAKRKHAGAQLANRQNPTVQDERGLPPMRAPPPSFQSAAAMEKQLEAEAAARWPEAGFGDPPPSEKLTVSIVKGPLGFGFTLGESHPLWGSVCRMIQITVYT